MPIAPEQRIEIRLLGPLQALVDGVLVPVGGPQPRALLTLLALSVGTTVAVDSLVDGVWGSDQPPAGAANTLQVYVSRLRRALGAEGRPPPIRSGAGGYLLDLPAEAIDVTRFERLAELGHEQLAGSEPGAARQTLAEAVGIWRGRALADLEGDAVTAVRSRLESRLVTAQAEHADALVALGQATVAVPELEHLVQLHPLDEGLVARLMAAQYHAGRQADALATYSTAAERLVEDLGVDPGAQLRAVHEAVLRQALEPVPARSAGPGSAGRGRTQTASDADARSRERLRSPRTALVGRERELRRILELLDDATVRIVTLLGPGGIGKTRLALAVADRMAPAARTAVVPLATATDEGELLATVAQVLGAEPEWPGQDLVELLAEQLGLERVVLVLDNLEQLLQSPGLPAVLVELLDRVPGLSLVLTSRIAVRLRDEHQVPLGPLGVPDRSATTPDEIAASESVQLFVERALTVAPGFALTDENAPAVAELCRMLDGQPLALELAAARTRILPPQDMVRRTGRLLHLLTGGSIDLPDRQRSMRAALDGSLQLLDDVEASVFAQLSVFAGGWTVAAAEQVCDCREDVVDVLGRLVDKSLVVADGSGRLGMLETVHEYAAERLAEAGEAAEDVRRRHMRYFAELASDVGTRFSVAPESGLRAELDAEAGNLTAALTHAAAVHDDTSFGQLVVGTLTYWFYSGRVAQGERWLARTDTSQLPPELRAKALLVIGNVALVKGDPGRAAEPLEGAVAAAREVGDPFLLARVLSVRGLVHRHTGAMARALEYVDEALQVIGTASDADPGQTRWARLRGTQQNERGEILDHLGSSDEARAMFEAYRQQALQDNDQSHLAWALINLALSECGRGQDVLGRELVQAALRAADEGGSTPIQGDAQMAAGLVELLVAGGDPGEAARRETEAARMLQSSGLLLTLPDTVSLLGAALLRSGRQAEAARMLAAGAAWRSGRGLVVVSRSVQKVITRAEADLAAIRERAAEPLARAIDDESARGAAVPFGLIDALDLPDGQPGARVQIHLVDLSRSSSGAATAHRR